ncbi:MAG TPA: hypothetical protein VFV51_07130, partial [Vicinamibacterales bacterium]|nr:hypothetical protein [Vicinamibacterales bacterium]
MAPGFTASGIYSGVQINICTTFAPFPFLSLPPGVTASPQTEVLAMDPAAISAILGFRGHGTQVWLVRALWDQALMVDTQQYVVHPIRVYSASVLGISGGVDNGSLSAAGGGTLNIRGNDLIGGFTTNDFNTTYSIVNAGGITGLSIVGDNLVIPAGQTALGNRTVTYRVCQAVTNTTNCQNVVANVFLVSLVSAGADSAAVSTLGSTVSVLSNDTINGLPATTANVTPSILGNGGIAGLAFNGSGQLVVPAGLATGTYTPSYQICDATDLMNCASAAVTITIAALPIVANADVASVTTAGGTVTVLGNDTFNAAAATAANVLVTIQNNGGIAGASVNA